MAAIIVIPACFSRNPEIVPPRSSPERVIQSTEIPYILDPADVGMTVCQVSQAHPICTIRLNRVWEMRMHLANPTQIAIVKPMTSNRTLHNVAAVPAGQARVVVRPGAVSYSSLFLLP